MACIANKKWYYLALPIWQNLEQSLIAKTLTVQKDIINVVPVEQPISFVLPKAIGDYLFKNCYLRKYKSVLSLYSHIPDYRLHNHIHTYTPTCTYTPTL